RVLFPSFCGFFVRWILLQTDGGVCLLPSYHTLVVCMFGTSRRIEWTYFPPPFGSNGFLWGRGCARATPPPSFSLLPIPGHCVVSVTGTRIQCSDESLDCAHLAQCSLSPTQEHGTYLCRCRM